MSEPLVTIVTPTYNMGHFLRETIESVLSQDYPHIQYIVIDAGSKDGTVEILKSYGSRIEWVSEPDEGQSDAVNKGVVTELQVFVPDVVGRRPISAHAGKHGLGNEFKVGGRIAEARLCAAGMIPRGDKNDLLGSGLAQFHHAKPGVLEGALRLALTQNRGAGDSGGDKLPDVLRAIPIATDKDLRSEAFTEKFGGAVHADAGFTAEDDEEIGLGLGAFDLQKPFGKRDGDQRENKDQPESVTRNLEKPAGPALHVTGC